MRPIVCRHRRSIAIHRPVPVQHRCGVIVESTDQVNEPRDRPGINEMQHLFILALGEDDVVLVVEYLHVPDELDLLFPLVGLNECKYIHILL